AVRLTNRLSASQTGGRGLASRATPLLPTMDITLAICTRGRSDLLRATLDSIAAADGAPCRWHVLLVDNDPDGSAAAIASAFGRRLPIDYAHEPVAGISSARNRA